MHIPDGFLDPWLCVLFYVISLIVLILSVKRVNLSEENIGLVSILTASVFAAQLLDWPIPGGTTAHFVGGALLGILFGPYLGSVVMSLILLIQALLFGDGGVTTLGANIWNMGIISVFSGYFIYRFITKLTNNRYKYVAAFIAGWFSTVLAAFFAGLELGLSTIFLYPIYVTIPAMVLWHLGFGLVDGLVTSGVVSYLERYKPEILGGE
jgi:cobalt/nickel transport system permease protein